MKEKNLGSNFWKRNSRSLCGYWVLVFVPFTIMMSIVKIFDSLELVGALIFLFLLFVAPFLFIVSYRRAKLNDFSEKIIFIFLGLVLPYVFMHLYFVCRLFKNFSLMIG